MASENEMKALEKELHMIHRTILKFQDEITRSVWHLEKRIESIQARLGIDLAVERATRHK